MAPPVAGYAAWYDATVGVTASGGAVSQWNDQSGNGFHLTQGTAGNKPTTGTRTVNSLNALDFDGGDQLVGSFTGLSGLNAYTVFVVHLGDAATQHQRVWEVSQSGQNAWDSADDGGTITRGQDDVSTTDEVMAGYNNAFPAAARPPGSTTSLSVAHITAVRRNADAWDLWQDGIAGSGTSGNSTTNVTSTSPQLRLGNDVGLSSGWDGLLCEVIIYPTALSTGDRQSVEAYLGARWAVTVPNGLATPAAVQLAYTRNAPAGTVTATPGAKQVTFTHNQPSAAPTTTATPGAKQLTFTRNAPTGSVSGSPAAKQVTFTQNTPTVTVPTNATATPASVHLTFTHNTSSAAGSGVAIDATVTIAPKAPARRSALGGRMRDLSTNLQGFSQEAVETLMRSGAAIFRPRFELYDALGNRVQPDLEGVTAAKVTYDEKQPIKLSLELTLLADERLRNRPFQYLVKPYFGLGPMPGGGFAEFSMGLYPWTRPKRVVYGTTGLAETWTITLGDMLHFLDLAGPGSEPFIVVPGQGTTAGYIWWVLYLAGLGEFDELFDITETGATPANDAWYTFVTTAKWAWKFQSSSDPQWTYNPSNTEAETWLHILQDLHSSAGFAEPVANLDGGYIARPDRDWANDPADVIYDTDPDSVTLMPVTLEPDLSMIANRVTAWTDTTGAEGDFGSLNPFYSAVADLNYYLPQHPLAQVNTRRYINQQIPNSLVTSQESLEQTAATELFKRLQFYETATLKRVGFLARHESYGIVGVRVNNDRELAGPAPFYPDFPWGTQPVSLYREVGWHTDLFTGDSESTLTRLYREQ